MDLVMIDYGAGNVQSVQYALERLGHRAEISADPERVARADKVIFPGVGAAKASMEALRARGLAEAIPKLQQPILGICVGMQVMGSSSDEGDTTCLGIVPGRVRKFASGLQVNVPHMGWNTLQNVQDWIPQTAANHHVYYVHSYAMDVGDYTTATTRYADFTFSAALRYRNFYGTQFHTEKSGDLGSQILASWLAAPTT